MTLRGMASTGNILSYSHRNIGFAISLLMVLCFLSSTLNSPNVTVKQFVQKVISDFTEISLVLVHLIALKVLQLLLMSVRQ